MPKLRVHNFSVSVDGFGAGPDQSLDYPLGVRGRSYTTGPSRLGHSARCLARRAVTRALMIISLLPATRLGRHDHGRNMFGPIRGEWTDEEWKGWWGDEPPYPQDVRLAGGVSAIQQYLHAGLVDEMHLAYAPLLLGSGERLWEGLDQAPAGYEIAEFVGTPAALHVRVVRKA